MWETKKKVFWGMPHFLLKKFGDKFIEPGLFEKQLAEDMLEASSLKEIWDEEDN